MADPSVIEEWLKMADDDFRFEVFEVRISELSACLKCYYPLYYSL